MSRGAFNRSELLRGGAVRAQIGRAFALSLSTDAVSAQLDRFES